MIDLDAASVAKQFKIDLIADNVAWAAVIVTFACITAVCVFSFGK